MTRLLLAAFGTIAFTLALALFVGPDSEVPVFHLLRPWLFLGVMTLLIVSAHIAACRRVFSRYLKHSHATSRRAFAVLAMLLVHMAQIQVYGVALYAYAQWTGERLAGEATGSVLDFMYFSYASYTSLGLGDIYPTGSLRLLAGAEALLGLLMIGITAALFVIHLRRAWFGGEG